MKKIIFLFMFIPSVVFSQWVQMLGLEGKITYCMKTNGSLIFVGTDTEGMYISSNNGANWLQSSLNNRKVLSLETNGNVVYAGTDTGIYISSNNGISWLQPTLINRSIYSILANSSNILAGPDTGGIFISTNGGLYWIHTSLYSRHIHCFAQGENKIYAGAHNLSGVYISSDGGMNWTQSSLNTQNVNCLAVTGNEVFAGVNLYGVYHSSDNGANWTQSGLNLNYVRSLAIYDNIVFAGTDSSVYLSTNNGTNWIKKGGGLPSGEIMIISLCTANNYLFAATVYNSVYRIPISEIIGIQPISSETPNQFSLSQNYPNPFNPSTKIKFDIPPSKGARGMITRLSIYDALGREIAVLVKERLSPGTYEVTWDGNNYPSGVYFYQLSINNEQLATKKMVLVK